VGEGPERDLRELPQPHQRRTTFRGLRAGVRRARSFGVRCVRRSRGFTILELMLVLAIVSVLAQIAVNEFKAQIMFAKRTEAVIGLNALWKAQKEHLGRTGRYAGTFDELNFGVIGGKQLGPSVYKGNRYTYQLSQPWGKDSFYCIATAQLDADSWPDILEIFEKDAKGTLAQKGE
jgi:prepilin-type N-terminal cleavage/methylation domain-containing protein